MERRNCIVRGWSTASGVILMTSILLAGCTLRKQVPIDRSILTDDPCAAPCWQGIDPGETTTAEAWEILADLEFTDNDRYPYPRWGAGDEQEVEFAMWRTLAHDDPAKSGNFFAKDGVVQYIVVALDFDLTLQEVLDKYGTPEKLQAHQPGIDRIITEIHFYYPQQGLIFVSWADPVPPSEPFFLDSTTPINVVHYASPASMNRLFDGLPRYARWRLPIDERKLQDWQGMGPIEVLD